MKTRIKNDLYLYLFCTLIGASAGAVIWGFLRVLALGTEVLWEWLPSKLNLPFYTVLLCTCGGAVIGIFRKMTGDYPEELSVVMGKMKTEKKYEYRNMPVLLIAAFLPLLIGSSVGPEAGMTGIIVGLCCWAGDNLKIAHQNAKEYSAIGTAVTLGVLFHSPLFGFFTVEEAEQPAAAMPGRTSKVLLYGLALGAGAGASMLLSAIFGSGMGGFPSFPLVEPDYKDFLMAAVYILCGCLLAAFYEVTHKGTAKLAGKLPGVLRETTGGLCLGVVGMLVPMMMFSGEEQMGELMTQYGRYLPLALAGAAFLKVLLTNVCIQLGLKGGHFFPVIFAGVCLGYGISMLVFPEGGHEVFGAAVVTASLLGGIMKKPLAVTMLLFICFPVKLVVWIFLGAAVGAKCANIGRSDEKSSKENKLIV